MLRIIFSFQLMLATTTVKRLTVGFTTPLASSSTLGGELMEQSMTEYKILYTYMIYCFSAVKDKTQFKGFNC